MHLFPTGNTTQGASNKN